MIDFNIVLETERIKLRPITREDLASYWKLTRDKSMWTYFTSDLSDYDELKKWVDEAIENISSGKRLAFTILNNIDNQVIGSTSFGNISDYDKRIEIGWTWIGRDFQGKGFNDHIKYLMLKYCFEYNDFERVELKTDVLNVPARKALSRIGFVEEGILRSHTLMIQNRRRDTIYYSVLRSEWTDIQLKKQLVVNDNSCRIN